MELDPDTMQVYKTECAYTDINGEPVKYSTDVWANSKEHAHQIQTSSLEVMQGIKNIKVTVSEPKPAKKES